MAEPSLFLILKSDGDDESECNDVSEEMICQVVTESKLIRHDKFLLRLNKNLKINQKLISFFLNNFKFYPKLFFILKLKVMC